MHLFVGVHVFKTGILTVHLCTHTHTYVQTSLTLIMLQDASLHPCETSLSLAPKNTNLKQCHSSTVTSDKLQKVELGKARPRVCFLVKIVWDVITLISQQPTFWPLSTAACANAVPPPGNLTCNNFALFFNVFIQVLNNTDLEEGRGCLERQNKRGTKGTVSTACCLLSLEKAVAYREWWLAASINMTF